MIASASLALKAAANWASSALILASSVAGAAAAVGSDKASPAIRAIVVAVSVFMLGSPRGSAASLALDTRPATWRLLRSARNDTANGGHCEERDDEAISAKVMAGVVGFALVPSVSIL